MKLVAQPGNKPPAAENHKGSVFHPDVGACQAFGQVVAGATIFQHVRNPPVDSLFLRLTLDGGINGRLSSAEIRLGLEQQEPRLQVQQERIIRT